MTKLVRSLSSQTLRDLKEVIRRVLHEMLDLRGIGRQPIRTGAVVYLAKTGASGIPAKAGSKLGKATVTLQTVDKNDNQVDHKDVHGVVVKVIAYNTATAAVAANTTIQIKQEILTGKLLVDWENCP